MLFFSQSLFFLCLIHSSTRTLYSRVSRSDVLVVLQRLQLSAAVDGGTGELFWILIFLINRFQLFSMVPHQIWRKE